ncbi:MAG TPA: ATP-grasp domain-containing protein [Candidatus Margulisiibacteriota bacterium]|nr:ATP-grasp domain-containing protein [Candidatus Margulisiibacteriota bacterium]
MKKLRILALMHAELVPPEDVSGYDVANVDWKTEFDVTSFLRAAGHEVHALGTGDDLRAIRTVIEEWKPHIAFNLLEHFHGIPIFDQNVVSYLELLRMPYTGCNPRGLMLARDKALSKKLLAFHRIPVPAFVVYPIGRAVRRPKRMGFPLIVKSLTDEGSVGISQASVVDDDDKLKERVRFIHQTNGTDAIVEQYIEGRELYVGLLGNQRVQVFPVWEMHFTKMPEEARRIATDRVKWSSAYQKKHGIKTAAAKNLPDAVAQAIQRMCKRVYRTLDLSGYARIDLRMDEQGRTWVIEANPNPQLAYGEDFAESAEHVGIAYEALLQRIVNLGLSWRPAWLR